jgi:cyanophycin synthetase
VNILSIQNYPGRNIYCHRPVVKAVLDLEDLYDTSTKDLVGFNEKLIAILPGIAGHYCSCGYEGGFLERLREGTYPAHVTEHITLELQSMAGYKVRYGQSRILKEPSIYSIVFEYVNEKTAAECFLAAVEIFNTLASGGEPDMARILGEIRKVAVETDLGPSTRAIYD